MTDAYPMRDPCPSCGSWAGRADVRGARDHPGGIQVLIWCADCDRYCYTAPHAEAREVARWRRRRRAQEAS